jgi:DsbC/DsbD-like thiol-disulfide interchange protein
MNPALKVALAFLMLFAGPVSAGELATPWTGKSPAQSRLILESGQFSGTGIIRAGVQIRLDDGWWTYWRAPGPTGMPPMFDWSGSENLADDPETIWPVPIRAVAYSENVNTYRKNVVFPIEFRPADPAKPIKLRLKIVYGVCRDMCVPSKADHEFTLRPTSGAPKLNPEITALIDAFTGRSPSADPRATGIEIREVRAFVENGKSVLVLRVNGLQGKGRTLLLIEGPNFMRVTEVKPGATGERNVALLKLAVGSTNQFRNLKGKRIRITLIDGGRALEQMWVVDTQGSSVSGLGMSPLPRGQADKPEPWSEPGPME